MVGLLDYGGGNAGSVLKAIRYLGYEAQPVSDPVNLSKAQKLVFPGQGHFSAMMDCLTQRDLLQSLGDFLMTGKPFLGICLGLQALYEGSDEAPDVPGLRVLTGQVKRFEGIFKVPHVGWSQLGVRQSSRLFRDVPDGSFVYYCHSYYAPPTPESVAVTEYGQTFAAGVEKENMWAVQFHPEKSGEIGLKVLQNFLDQ